MNPYYPFLGPLPVASIPPIMVPQPPINVNQPAPPVQGQAYAQHPLPSIPN